MSYLVIAQDGTRVMAVETAGQNEDWPPAPMHIIDRWLVQGAIGEDTRLTIWEERGGWHWKPAGSDAYGPDLDDLVVEHHGDNSFSVRRKRGGE